MLTHLGVLAAGIALGAVATRVLSGRKGTGILGQDPRGMGLLLIRDRRIQWANARAAEILGVEAEALRGAGTRTYHLDEAAYEAFAATALAACEREGRFQGDVRMRRVDGTPFWAHLVGSPVAGQGVLWYLEDATERVEARLGLEEVLSLNEKLIAASPTGIILFRDADGACVLANEAAAEILGATRQELELQNFRRIRPWRGTGLREAAEAALATGQDQELECHLITSSGKEVWMVAHFVPFLSRGEKVLLLLVDDVSEKMKVASALRESEAKYRVVVEALNEGLVLIDSAGCLVFCNSRLLEMGGYREDEIRGTHYSVFVDEPDLPRLQDQGILERLTPSRSFEIGLRRRDGRILETRVSIASVPDDQGELGALAILVTDISVSKRIEREREVLVGELEQKNRELETLLYVASHDLRSPLVNVQGFSQRLARSLDEIRRLSETAPTLAEFRQAAAPHLEERMPGSLEFIRASGVKMDAIINGLLTLSRAGRMVLRTEALDMNELLRSCSATLAFQFESAGGILQVEELPPCMADAAQVAQILSNLLDNAIKYRHPDRPLRVRVTGERSEGTSLYRVEDNGLGIPPEHQERIWDIFQRLAPQGPIPGDGLGLTLVRRMAERNGGRVQVESAPGNGTRFRLELPAASP